MNALRAFACLCASLAATSAAAAPVELADGVVLIPGQVNQAGKQPDGNTLLFRGTDGWVVFDTGRHAEHTAQALDHATYSGADIVAVVNSHWHLDHTGGNPRIRDAFPTVRIYASGGLDIALQGFLARSRAYIENRLPQIDGNTPERVLLERDLRILQQADRLRPDETVTESGALTVGGRAFDIHLSRAVSAGDVWLVDTASGVLAAGDLITIPAPFLDTACPERWLTALDELAAVPFSVAVPGHGPVLDRAGVRRYRDMAYALVACAASDRAAGECADAWVVAAGGWLDPADRDFARAVTLAHLERGVLAAGGEQAAVMCAGGQG